MIYSKLKNQNKAVKNNNLVEVSIKKVKRFGGNGCISKWFQNLDRGVELGIVKMSTKVKLMNNIVKDAINVGENRMASLKSDDSITNLENNSMNNEENDLISMKSEQLYRKGKN